jgi:cytochrome c
MGAAGEAWTYEHLNDFLLAPAGFAPGTKMKFGGLKNDADRANVIAYLSTLSANPLPFPPPEPAEGTTAETDAVAAGGEPVATGADAVATPTVTQGETAVEGTPTTSGTGGAPATGADGAVVPEVPAQ